MEERRFICSKVEQRMHSNSQKNMKYMECVHETDKSIETKRSLKLPDNFTVPIPSRMFVFGSPI
jgi:predicted DNA-binding protein (UPF0278 family)